MLKVKEEKLVALCAQCKCCLAMGSHCWICHNDNSIETLCGCGTCSSMANDYAERTMHRYRFNNKKL